MSYHSFFEAFTMEFLLFFGLEIYLFHSSSLLTNNQWLGFRSILWWMEAQINWRVSTWLNHSLADQLVLTNKRNYISSPSLFFSFSLFIFFIILYYKFHHFPKKMSFFSFMLTLSFQYLEKKILLRLERKNMLER